MDYINTVHLAKAFMFAQNFKIAREVIYSEWINTFRIRFC